MLVQFFTIICIPFPIYNAFDKEHLHATSWKERNPSRYDWSNRRTCSRNHFTCHLLERNMIGQIVVHVVVTILHATSWKESNPSRYMYDWSNRRTCSRNHFTCRLLERK